MCSVSRVSISGSILFKIFLNDLVAALEKSDIYRSVKISKSKNLLLATLVNESEEVIDCLD